VIAYIADTGIVQDVPLLQRSMKLWRDLLEFQMQNSTNRDDFPEEPLLNIVGSLMIGSLESDVVAGTLKSIKTHELPHEIISANDLKFRYPCFEPKENETGIFETDAGYLIPELCIKYYLQIARKHGVELHFEEKFESWIEIDSPDGKVIEVTTNLSKYYCKKLVLSVGPWAPLIYGKDIAVPLAVERRVLFWLKPLENEPSFKVSTPS
jgi:sarcosine oxidase